MVLSYINNTRFMRRRRRKFNRKYPRIGKLASTAGRLFNVEKQVSFMKGMINSEKYVFDTAITVANLSNTGNITNLNQIATGDDAGQRTGNSILARRLTCKYTIQDTTPIAAEFTRVLIFYDIQQNGTDPTLSQILQDTSNVIVSPINQDNNPRFWILYDRIHGLDTYNNTKTGRMSRSLKMHIKFTGTAAANYGMNSLYVLLISDQAGASGVSVTFYSRLQYYDN